VPSLYSEKIPELTYIWYLLCQFSVVKINCEMSTYEAATTADDAVPQDRRPQSYTADIGNGHHDYTPMNVTSEDTDEKNVRTTETELQALASHTTSSSPPMRLHATWVDSWTAEVLSCALSVIALACLVSALRYFDGYVVTKLPLKVSINTLVAVFAAIIKSSLLLPVAEGMLLCN
jgi:hypothetical protein